ncbi:MAG: GldG family protein [Sandaracinaceae bacterium]
MANPKSKSGSSKASSSGAKKGPAQTGRGRQMGTEAIMYVAITLVVAVLANVAGYYVYHRFDLTEARLYSLSDGSKRLVSDLEDDMEITAYFTADLPPPFNATEIYVRNLLLEYEAAGGGHVQVRFVNPDDDEEKEDARRDGVQEVPHQLIENDSVSVRNGYRGLVIKYLGQRQTIPVIQDTQGLEYEITQAIRQLVQEPTPVGVMEGHGSPSPTEGLTTLAAALPSYELRAVNVGEAIDPELRALLIVNPTEPITEPELRRINQYLMNGGSVGIFGGAMNVNIQGMAPSASAVDTGVNTLLANWGVQLGSSIVADARCGRVPLRTPIGIPIPVAYPPAPIVVFDEDAQIHPVLFRLNQAPFFFTSPIEVSDTFNELHGQILARSSADASWLLTGDTIQLQPRDPSEWTITGERGPFDVMVALEGQLPSAFPDSAASGGEGGDIDAPAQAAESVRVLVAGSGSLLRDEFLPSAEQGRQAQMTAGVALALNAIDWLTQDQDLIAIRAKSVEDPALDVPQSVILARDEALTAAQEGDEQSANEAVDRYNAAIEAWDTKKKFYRYGMLLLPLVVIVFGLIRWQMRHSRRLSLQSQKRPDGRGKNPMRSGAR